MASPRNVLRFAPAYTRIDLTAAGYTVRGFEGRVYRTLAGAKSAARYIEAREQREVAAILSASHARMVADLRASYARTSRGARAQAHGVRQTSAAAVESVDFDGVLDFGMVG
jgi:hypothetical protein